MDYFTFNGISSVDYDIYLVNDRQRQQNNSPTKTTISEKITGKNGSIIFDQTYDGREIRLKCYFDSVNPSTVREMMGWLGGSKYPKQLVLSYEPYKVYTATFENQVNVNEYVNGGIFELVFKCYSPFAESIFTTQNLEDGVEYDLNFYYDTGLYYTDSVPMIYSYTNIITDTDMDIYNASNVDGCCPKIIINGSGDSLTINHYSDELRTDLIASYSYGSFSGELIIDSKLRNTFLDGTVNNATSNGDYFEMLNYSFNYFSIGGVSINLTTVDWDFKYIYL